MVLPLVSFLDRLSDYSCWLFTSSFMKLEKVLDQLNSFEKNSFLKIIDGIIAENPGNQKEIDKILSDYSRELKYMDTLNIVRVFDLVRDEYRACIENEFLKTSSQIDVLIDIIIRDGNCIMKLDWFSRLYETEIRNIKKKFKSFEKEIENDRSNMVENRRRDYKIYRRIVDVAYHNEELINQEGRITFQEQSILNELTRQLELSQEEVKLLNYIVLGLNPMPIDEVINELKNIGVIFYSKKLNTIYVADEMVRLLRRLRGKELADKHFRRVLRQLKEAQINLICRKHGIPWKDDLEIKIHAIIKEGIAFRGVLENDIYRDNTTVTEKKQFINELCDRKLKITPSIRGSLLEEKIDSLVGYFDGIEKDEKVGISIEGYDKMLRELYQFDARTNQTLRSEFELQDENVMSSNLLLDYNIKPRDVLEAITEEKLQAFCEAMGIRTRGNLYENTLEYYRDAENMYLENYAGIGFRDLNGLKANGIDVREADLGVLFETLTKKIFSQLGFDVDESLRKSLNTTKDKIDILLNLGKNSIIIIECKSAKESGYNKFSSVSRQLKAYIELAKKKDLRVIKSLLIAPEFSDDFIKDCGLDYELNLSLIMADSLYQILNGFRESKLKSFPHNLLMRDVLIQEERVVKALGR